MPVPDLRQIESLLGGSDHQMEASTWRDDRADHTYIRRVDTGQAMRVQIGVELQRMLSIYNPSYLRRGIDGNELPGFNKQYLWEQIESGELDSGYRSSENEGGSSGAIDGESSSGGSELPDQSGDLEAAYSDVRSGGSVEVPGMEEVFDNRGDWDPLGTISRG